MSSSMEERKEIKLFPFEGLSLSQREREHLTDILCFVIAATRTCYLRREDIVSYICECTASSQQLNIESELCTYGFSLEEFLALPDVLPCFFRETRKFMGEHERFYKTVFAENSATKEKYPIDNFPFKLRTKLMLVMQICVEGNMLDDFGRLSVEQLCYIFNSHNFHLQFEDKQPLSTTGALALFNDYTLLEGLQIYCGDEFQVIPLVNEENRKFYYVRLRNDPSFLESEVVKEESVVKRARSIWNSRCDEYIAKLNVPIRDDHVLKRDRRPLAWNRIRMFGALYNAFQFRRHRFNTLEELENTILESFNRNVQKMAKNDRANTSLAVVPLRRFVNTHHVRHVVANYWPTELQTSFCNVLIDIFGEVPLPEPPPPLPRIHPVPDVKQVDRKWQFAPYTREPVPDPQLVTTSDDRDDLFNRICYHILLCTIKAEVSEQQLYDKIASNFNYDLNDVLKLGNFNSVFQLLHSQHCIGMFIIDFVKEQFVLRWFLDQVRKYTLISGYPYSSKLRIVACINDMVSAGMANHELVTEDVLIHAYQQRYAKSLDEAEVLFLFGDTPHLATAIQRFLWKEVGVVVSGGTNCYHLKRDYYLITEATKHDRLARHRDIAYWVDKLYHYGKITRQPNVFSNMHDDAHRKRQPLRITECAVERLHNFGIEGDSDDEVDPWQQE